MFHFYGTKMNFVDPDFIWLVTAYNVYNIIYVSLHQIILGKMHWKSI